MDYMNQNEQEYIRFMIKLGNKANEIEKEYNKLSDKNKYIFQVFVKEMMRINTVLNIK